MLVEGKRQYVFDEHGRRYLDGFAGIVTTGVGHGHPAVVAAVAEQTRSLAHTTSIYAHPQVALYSSELAARLPPSLGVLFFVNSGSEATELALTLARAHTGRPDVIALRNGYHGISASATAVTGQGDWRQAGSSGLGGPVQFAQCPNAYLGRHGSDGAAYAADVAELLAAACPGGKVAAFLAESTQGVGGVVPLAPGYLPAVYPLIRAAGGVCIADEVQSGFGRTGAHYWGFQAHGVLPDIVTMAKAIGNGFPLGAVACTHAIASSLTGRWLNTYGGNPVACAAGRAVLRITDEEGLQANAAKLGEVLKTRLNSLAAKHDLIGDVRGYGLMQGVELVTCRNKKSPAVREAIELLELARAGGLLLGRGGRGNVLRITPPLCVSAEDIDFLVDVMDVARTCLRFLRNTTSADASCCSF
jgi:alanine-glyoxylate transaminase/(R)-3-amino-2-methylpropionate-pyruvate transaminase